MIDISKLSKDDIFKLIDSLPLDYVKYFIENASKSEQGRFQQLFSGFRIKSISIEKIRFTFKNNIKNKLVTNIISAYAYHLKSIITNKRQELIDTGIDSNSALIYAISEEIMPELYDTVLKVMEIDFDEKYIAAIKVCAEAINKNAELQEELEFEKNKSSNTLTLESKSIELNNKISALIAQVEAATAERDSYSKMLKEANDSNQKLRAQISERKSKEIVPENPFVSNIQEQHISLCRVKNNGYGKKYLIRLADVISNEIVIFVPIAQERLFNNRDRLFFKNGPSEDGAYAVWDWSTIENPNNPEIDIVKSYHNSSCQPIQVCTCNNCESFDELLELIKNGTQLLIVSKRILFICSNDNDTVDAILCSESELQSIGNNAVRLKKDVMYVKSYKVRASDVLFLGEEKAAFYKYVNMPIKGVLISVYSPLEMTKQILLKRFNWNFGKAAGIGKKEWQTFHSLLDTILTDDLYNEIMDNCMCSHDEAQQYITELIQNSELLVKGEDIESKVLASIIECNPELLEKSKSLVSDEWHAEQRKMIESEMQKLTDISNKHKTISNEIITLRQEKSQIVSEINDGKAYLEKREKIAAEVEKGISDKIKAARENAAEFISEMAFIAPLQSAYSGVSTDCEFSGVIPGYIPYDAEIEELEYTSSNSLIEELLVELFRDAGISREFRKAFAAFLYGAFCSKIPVMLAGPNSFEIANGFCLALFGKTAASFDCSCKFSRDTLENILNSDAEIMVISNILHSEWMPYIDRIISTKSYVIFYCAFAEDLIIEPKGLLNYIVPVFTEIIVDSTPESFSIRGRKSNDFVDDCEKNTGSIRYAESFVREFMKNTHVNRIYASHLSQIIASVRSIIPQETSSMEFLFGYVPSVYVSQNNEEIIDILKNKMNSLSKELRLEVLNFMGVTDEEI